MTLRRWMTVWLSAVSRATVRAVVLAYGLLALADCGMAAGAGIVSAGGTTDGPYTTAVATGGTMWKGIADTAPDALEVPVSLSERPERLIRHTGYTVSFNGEWRIPNWVAYELTPEETTGPATRSNRFVPDPEVPPHETATTDDYRHSGYDRGHMAPAADMKWSEQAMRESFYLSNICPQAPALNRGVWKHLEEFVRQRAATHGSIYVACGPLAAGDAPRIGRRGVVVPHGFFKALLQEADGRWTAIGFVFDNEGTEGNGMAKTKNDGAGTAESPSSRTTAGMTGLSVHAVSIDSLERLTGLDFFPALPDSIETVIESETDPARWGL